MIVVPVSETVSNAPQRAGQIDVPVGQSRIANIDKPGQHPVVGEDIGQAGVAVCQDGARLLLAERAS
jgi:hypothetical protein